MATVRQILDRKPEVYWVEPGTTVLAALSLMAEKNVGALVVLELDQLVGIFSERDYARKIVLEGKSSRDTPVRQVMTTQVICVGPQRSAGECMALMTEKRVRHLPVMENGSVVGVISIGDVVRAVVEEQRFQIEQLENFIKG
jgi:CBS domain-containing protein